MVFLFALPAPAQEAKTAPIVPQAPETLPAMRYKDEAGEIRVFAPRAKLTVLHFWATWCVPCLAELPEVDRISAEFAPRGAEVVAVSLDTGMDKVKAFYAEKKIAHLPAWLDHGNSAFSAARLKGLPGTLFFNEKGEAVARADGPVDWESDAAKKFIEEHL